MPRRGRLPALPRVVAQKPLQVAKFVAILLVLLLGVGGFLRVVDATAFVDHPLLGDGQFLALVLIPVLAVGLLVVVFLEALVSGYRVVRSDAAIGEQVSGRVGYLVLRVGEAAVAIAGLTVMATAVSALSAESMPAPAGVGVLLLLMATGLGILFAGFVRSFAELFVYGDV